MEIFYAYSVSDGTALLDGDESVHCAKVLRKKTGDEISVFDGSGSLFRCRITDDSPKHVEAVVQEEEKNFGTHPYSLTMAVCPTKNIDRYEWFVEKATEIGVDVIAPVIGDHSERKILKTDRLHRLVLSAAKQSLKGRLPEVAEPVSVRDFINSAPETALKLIAYCFDEDSRASVQDVLRSRPEQEIIILIGPEGDFSGEEAALALSKGWIPVSLGDSRLRTETAAVVAATAVYLR